MWHVGKSHPWIFPVLQGLSCMYVDSPVLASKLHPHTPESTASGAWRFVHQWHSLILGGGNQALEADSGPLEQGMLGSKNPEHDLGDAGFAQVRLLVPVSSPLWKGGPEGGPERSSEVQCTVQGPLLPTSIDGTLHAHIVTSF